MNRIIELAFSSVIVAGMAYAVASEPFSGEDPAGELSSVAPFSEPELVFAPIEFGEVGALSTTNYTSGGTPYNIRATSVPFGDVENTEQVYTASELDLMLDSRLPSWVYLTKKETDGGYTYYEGETDFPSTGAIMGKPLNLYFSSASVSKSRVRLIYTDGVTTSYPTYYHQMNSSQTELTTHVTAGYTCQASFRMMGGAMSVEIFGGRDVDTEDHIGYRCTYHQQIKAAEKLVANTIIVGTSSGYINASANKTFDMNYPVLYTDTAQATVGSNLAAGKAWLHTYNAYARTGNGGTGSVYPQGTTQYVPGAALFMLGTVDGDMFTITNWSYEAVRPCIPLGTFSPAATAVNSLTFNPGHVLLPDPVIPEIPEQDIDVSVKTVGGWKDPYFWLPKVTAGSGTSRQTVVERTGAGLGITGDTSLKRAYNDSNEAYVLDVEIEPERLADASDIPSISGTWTLVSDSSGSCTLDGNVLKGGGQSAVCVVRFTDSTGKSKECTVEVGPWSRQEVLIQNPWSEYDNTFRKAYSDAILQKFATLDYSSGHVFPNFLRFNRDRNYPCYFGKEPWESELFSDYDNYATTRSLTWNNSTNYTMFTGGVHDQANPTYQQTQISYAQGPKTMNADFFWPDLQAKLCSVSGERADWYAHRTAIRISKHYLLAAAHYNQSWHKFFDPTTGTRYHVTVDGQKTYNQIYQEATGGTAGTDWLIQYIPDGAMPDTIPCMEFIGPHGNETNVVSLFHLSPSLLNGAPAIQLSQANTVNLAYLSTSAPGDRVDGIYAPTNRVNYSHRLTLSPNWNWVNTSYPALNARHPYYNVRIVTMKDGTDFSKKVTIADIADISDHNPALEDDFMLYKGEHYVIAGDSARPLMGWYNGHLWLYGLYFMPGGGDTALDNERIRLLDEWIRQDSASRYGVEEGLTIIDCCTLDPSHTYHSH